MSQKTKSILYFTGFVISALCYYSLENVEIFQKNEFAQIQTENME
jgi:cytosine/uracil/thiamine/allantoin permease